MKILFVSDIHGIKKNLRIIQEKYQEFHCEKIVVLGDLYYAAWQYQNSEDYDKEYVRDFLDSYGDRLLCVRGNCDSDEDKEFGHFTVIDDYIEVLKEPINIYATHGHIYNENNWNKEKSVLVFGHYHIPFIEERGNNLFINPGSISLPKEDYNPSFLIWDEKTFTIYDVEGNIIAQKEINY